MLTTHPEASPDTFPATVREPLRRAWAETLTAWLAEHTTGMETAAAAYFDYSTLGDRALNRPVTLLLGYGATRKTLGPALLDELGPVALVPQAVRDLLAVHDDVVDGDPAKFDRPTLHRVIGDGAAVYTGDLLLGLIGDLVDQAPADIPTRYRLHRLIWRAIRRNQRGQLTELALEQRHPATIPTPVLEALYADKAAEYCYALPFELGTTLAGTHTRLRQLRPVLETIGVASQIVDDLAGTCDGGKDTPGELLHLRRTVLLTHLAHHLTPHEPLTPLLAATTADAETAAAVRTAFLTTGAAATTAHRALELADHARQALHTLPLEGEALDYLHHLIDTRITTRATQWAHRHGKAR
ncbi:polyprenyl synthetase family protein (plasmid) [Streptomyces sp. BI20]|uniref:polyprenyl synthetase family protein n=1 Tax=Streptomyces sp. BI20 TaxID=3403460 RepID=UPI003C7253B9